MISLYTTISFYTLVHIALFLVIGYLSKRLQKYSYLKYLSGYFLWSMGFGLGYFLFFSPYKSLQGLSYLIFMLSFIGATNQLICIVFAVSDRIISHKTQLIHVLLLTTLFIILISIKFTILLNILVSTVGLLSTFWFWGKGRSYRLIGPLIFSTTICSLLFAIYKSPDALQIQLLLSILFRIFLSILLVSIAQEQADKEKKLLSEQLHHSEKMDALGQLASGISHDFNNMLAGIVGAAEILKFNEKSEEKIKMIELIMNAAHRAGDLTRKLLTFSRKETKESHAIDIEVILKDTIEILKRTIDKSIEITTTNDATSTVINGDDSMMQNAFLNMGINASHAMPNGGKLEFALNNEELTIEYCKASTFDLIPGMFLEIAIRDTGQGMSFETQQKIFEPFFTTKKEGKGTGLGLAAVYGMIQEHNGAVTVYSEEGKGTVFHLYLPLLDTPKEEKDDQTKEIQKGSGTVLVIDDEYIIRQTVYAELKSLGYKVLLAENGKKGIDVFQQSKNTIDYIILDMIMPEMNGLETLKKIRTLDNTIPVLISSGFSKENELLEIKELEISGFLHKPFKLEELSLALKKAQK